MTKQIFIPPSPPQLYRHSAASFRPYQPLPSNLFSLVSSPLTHVGGYLIDPSPGGADPTFGLTYSGRVKIARGSQADRIFFTGHDEGNAGKPFIAEAQIPAIVSGVDNGSRNTGAIVQPYRSIDVDFTLPGPEYEVNGLYYDPATQRLSVGGHIYYDANANQTVNYMYYANGGDLAGSAKQGGFSIGEGARFGGQVIPLPPAWQSAFGGTHLVHNGIRMSIVTRASLGPNAAVVNAASMETGLLDVALNYPYADNESTHLGGSLQTAQIWNFLSDVAGAFVVPETDTLMFIGSNWVKNFGPDDSLNIIQYKGVNDIGVTSGGYDPYYHQAYENYYWLYDLNDLYKTITDPVTYPAYSHQPYEYGFLNGVPNSGFNNLVTGAFLHPDTGQIHLAVAGGADPAYGIPCFEVYEF